MSSVLVSVCTEEYRWALPSWEVMWCGLSAALLWWSHETRGVCRQDGKVAFFFASSSHEVTGSLCQQPEQSVASVHYELSNDFLLTAKHTALDRVTIAMMNHCDQKQAGMEMVYLAYVSTS